MPLLTEDISFKKHYVRFYMHPQGKLNKRLSEERGYPVYEDLEKVEIRQAGDTKMINHYNAHDPSSWIDPDSGKRLTYCEVWPKQYEQFKANQDQIGDGTRLEVLPGLTPAKIASFQRFGIHTIEALGAVDGENLKTLGMFGREFKDKANKWLAQKAKFANEEESARKLAVAEERIAKLEALVEQSQQEDNLAVKRRSQKAAAKREKIRDGKVEDKKQKTPFDDWADENIVAWLSDNGEEGEGLPRHKLMELAMSVYNAAKKESEAA